MHVAGVINNRFHLQPRWEVEAGLIQLLLHRAAHGQGIAAIALIDPYRHGGLAIEIASDRAITLLAKAHGAEILQSHAVAAAQRFDDQVLQLLLAAQPPFHPQGQGVLLAFGGWGIAHLAEGRQHVLPPQGSFDILNREFKTAELGGIQPQAIGQIAAAKQHHIANAIDAQQRLAHLPVHPAADEGARVGVGVVAEAQHHQQVAAAAPHPQTLTAHWLRQLPAD